MVAAPFGFAESHGRLLLRFWALELISKLNCKSIPNEHLDSIKNARSKFARKFFKICESKINITGAFFFLRAVCG